MTRAARIAVDPAAVKPSKAIKAAARIAPLLVVTGRALLDLERELGSWDAAGRYLLSVAETIGKPVGVNLPTGAGTSRAMVMAPRSWSPERLQGWVAVHHEAIEWQFGTATPVQLEDS